MNSPLEKIELYDSGKEAIVLEKECQKIHFQLYGSAAPKDIVNRYIDAQKKILPDQSDRLPPLVLKIVNGNYDIEAIEFYWRIRNFSPILQQKTAVLLFLTESQGQYVNYFYQFKPGVVNALGELSFLFFRSAYLFIKGFFLSGWLKLV